MKTYEIKGGSGFMGSHRCMFLFHLHFDSLIL